VILTHLGNEIKAARKELGMTQADLGEKVGTSKQAIARIEAGNHNVSILILEKIATALNCKLANPLLIK
jgi:transcriptional regulator with XRE-family HTH domain